MFTSVVIFVTSLLEVVTVEYSCLKVDWEAVVNKTLIDVFTF